MLTVSKHWCKESRCDLDPAHRGVSSDASPGFPLVLFLAPVVFFCVAECVAAGDRHRLGQTLPKVSVGDLPAGPRARAG